MLGSPEQVARLLRDGPSGATTFGAMSMEQPPLSTRGMPSEGPDYVRWQEQIRQLDHQEMELYQSQARVVRDQIIRDVLSLKAEVEDLRNKRNGDAAALDSMRDQLRDQRATQADLMALRSQLRDLPSQVAEMKVQHNALSLEQAQQATLIHDLDRRLLDHHRKISDEALAPYVDALRKAQDSIAHLSMRCGGLEDRVTKDMELMVARQFGALEDKIQQFRDATIKDLDAVKRVQAGHGHAIDGLRGLHAEHASLADRFMKFMGDSADKHAKEMASIQASIHKSHSNLDARLSACEAQDIRHALLKERVDHLETLLHESTDKHAKLLGAAHGRLDEMHGRVTACERTGVSLLDLKKSYTDLTGIRTTLASEFAALKARVSHLEGLLEGSTDRFSRELANLKAAYDKHALALDKHARDMEELAAAHGEKHTSLGESLGLLERTLGDHTDKLAADVAELHRKAEQLHVRVGDERAERRKKLGAMKELIAGEQAQRSTHHTSLSERMECLEGRLGEGVERHNRALGETQTRLSELQAWAARHEGLGHRIEHVERALPELAKRDEVAAAASKIDFVYSRLSVIREAWRFETPRSPDSSFTASRLTRSVPDLGRG